MTGGPLNPRSTPHADFGIPFEPPLRRHPMLLKRRALTIALGLTASLALCGTVLAQEVYIPLVSKGFQHQFWQAVKLGAENAAKEFKVKVT